MGVNVTIWAYGRVTREELETADKFVTARCRWWFDAKEFPSRLTSSSLRAVEFETFSRYYGPGYERGDWPELYGAILAIQAALPQCKVFYGNDSGDEEEVTQDFLVGMWTHWLSEDGLAYYR